MSYRYLDFSSKESWNIRLEGKIYKNSEIRIYINKIEVCQLACYEGEKIVTGTLYTTEKKADLRIEFLGNDKEEILQINEISFS